MNIGLDFRVYIKYNETMPRKKRMGRPPKAAAEKRSEQVNVRVTKAERARLETEAKRLGISLSVLLMYSWRNREKRRD